MSESVKKKSSGNTLKILILIVLVLLLVGGAGFGGFYFASKSTPKANTETKVIETEPVDEAFYEAGEFLVNLADEGGKRYLKVKLVLAYNSESKKLPEELETKKTVIADSVIGVLRGKKTTDLSTVKGPEDLKKEIVTRVNSVLSSGKLTNVYYNDFFVQ